MFRNFNLFVDRKIKCGFKVSSRKSFYCSVRVMRLVKGISIMKCCLQLTTFAQCKGHTFIWTSCKNLVPNTFYEAEVHEVYYTLFLAIIILCINR